MFLNEKQYEREREAHKDEIMRLRQEHAAQLSERSRHEVLRVDSLQAKVNDLELRLAAEIKAKETAIDRLMYLGVGAPLYRQLPEQTTAAPAEEPPDERHPTDVQQDELAAIEAERNAANRNPRRMVRSTTMRDTVDHNRRKAEDGINQITRAIEVQAAARAAEIAKVQEQKKIELAQVG